MAKSRQLSWEPSAEKKLDDLKSHNIKFAMLAL